MAMQPNLSTTPPHKLCLCGGRWGIFIFKKFLFKQLTNEKARCIIVKHLTKKITKENGEMKILAVKNLALTKQALYLQPSSPFFARGFIREG